jgi:hypothetical protein
MTRPDLHLCWTLTAGRTGTTYLYQLLRQNIPDCAAYHERAGNATLYGVHAPDLQTMGQFNNFGPNNNVLSFWITKFSLVLDELLANDRHYYIEMSHILWKAGLVEASLKMQRKYLQWHYIMLERDFYKTMLSFYHRYDFYAPSNLWLWYLEPTYKNNIVPFKPFADHINTSDREELGWALRLWYLHETRARTYRYRAQYKRNPNYHFYKCEVNELNEPEGVQSLLKWLGVDADLDDIIIPPPKNVTQHPRKITKKEEKWIEEFIEAME